MFTGNGRRLTARTNPAGPFTFIDTVSVNNSGTVAFFADDTSGAQGIFIESREQDAPRKIVKSGDPLFGSIVTGVKLGRFSLNDRQQVVFQYGLQDGRSGIAIATPHGGD